MKNLSRISNLALIFALCLAVALGCSTQDDSITSPDPEQTENEGETDSGESEGTDGNEDGGEGSDGNDESDGNDGGEGGGDDQGGTEGSDGNNGDGGSGGEGGEASSDGGQVGLADIFERISSTEELSLFEDALLKVDLAHTLAETDTLTVFAPTDAAVEQLFVLLGDDYNSFDDFQNLIERQILREILLGHFTEGKLPSDNFKTRILPTLLPEDFIELRIEENDFVIWDATDIHANFLSLDLEASDGTVHIIDKILIPQKALTLVD